MSAELIASQPHGCPTCKPEMLPDRRLGFAHTAIRFGDETHRVESVTIDGGEDIKALVNEAFVTRKGFVIAMHCDAEGRGLHSCPICHTETCVVRVDGYVRGAGVVVQRSTSNPTYQLAAMA